MKRILLVDDDANTLVAMRTLLESEGFRVDACDDGRRAIERLQADRYDELLTDLVMPAVDGLALAREARSLQPGIRCIVLSGSIQPRELSADVDVWLSKPLDVDALMEVLL